ncbi:MAG: hypothetical protein ACRDTT_05900, partial [Pseudonocardiaceae bacterium]
MTSSVNKSVDNLGRREARDRLGSPLSRRRFLASAVTGAAALGLAACGGGGGGGGGGHSAGNVGTVLTSVRQSASLQHRIERKLHLPGAEDKVIADWKVQMAANAERARARQAEADEDNALVREHEKAKDLAARLRARAEETDDPDERARLEALAARAEAIAAKREARAGNSPGIVLA